MQEQAIEEKVKERYGKIALITNSESCYAPTESCDSSEIISTVQIAKAIGYDAKDLVAVPESPILGVECGALVSFADINEGEVVVDIGSVEESMYFCQQSRSKTLEK